MENNRLEPKYPYSQILQTAKDFKLLKINSVVEKGDFDFVYRPCDDTYLFIDTLLAELPELLTKEHLSIAEIGCGSGYLICNLCYFLGQKNNPPSLAIASDINFDACYFTQKLSNFFNCGVIPLNTSFLEGVKDSSLDMVLCNPVR